MAATAAPYYFLEYAPANPRGASIPGSCPLGAVPSTGGREPLDVLQIRRDFPILQERSMAVR